MKFVVTAAWLLEHKEDKNLVIADCRFRLDDVQAGDIAYRTAHLPGAVRLDLDRDLTGGKGEHGGRHPLPDLARLAGKLGELGIGSGTTVVAYDDQGGAMASRLWWLLRYAGHEGKAYILDGGYTGWEKAGYPLDSAGPAPIKRDFRLQVRPEMTADVEEVRSKLGQPGVVLVDSREAPRYRGEAEPIDRKAGHIPGAVNRFWGEGRGTDGAWKSAEAQSERFADLSRDDEIIVYCGSGVTACPNVMALEAAGFTRVKLYPGSWSDWISYADNPIATGEE
ncbi:sulfurtransferase [Paenibacillus nasutitermitis]|uniref:Thiosulfate sulfurtransferase n=1 Tax=Paenibacillus nasutitermitis TaxID=1652958 RepID=A0A916ZGJ8_9BACL|nr:sulfurtransferase [Paenibacillus nasutitermitis]GGD96576.1 thiosulfate sulfurtransferase [Paenibacillus nasutitermitis]